jgi:nucleoside-diphosphate-sugar epimerase
MIATFGKGGFIGSYLPAEFVGVDADVRTSNHGWPRGKGFEAAVNLACVQPARGAFPFEDYFDINVMGMWGVLAWAWSWSVPKVIAMNSQKTSMQGEVGKLVRADIGIRQAVAAYRHEFRMKAVVLRLPPVIGTDPAHPFIKNAGLGQMIEGAKQGRIEVWGEPSNSRAVISIHDAVSAIQFLVRSDLQGVFSIGIPLSLESEVKAVQEVYGGELVYRPEIDNGIRQDIEVSGIPGWEPRWDFERMVRELKDAT